METSQFIESLQQRLGSQVEVGNLIELGVEVMSQYDPYEGKSQNKETFPMLNKEPEVTPELWTVCEHRNIAPKRGQDGQRLSGMPEV